MIREALENDVEEMLAIQKKVYPRILWNTNNEYSSIVRYGNAWVKTSENGQIIGFIMTHPYYGYLPDLHTVFREDVEEETNDCFIFDLIVLPEYQRCHIGTQLVETLFEYVQEKNIKRLYLVSLQDSQKFWMTKGFLRENPVHIPKCYHNGIFMTKNIY